jgi:murein DD-endopeptidase MepM/ murein hydrolase activator NlpD
LEHNINQNKIYTLYGHLENIQEGLKEGDFVKKGDIIGMVGASGYGCSNY